MNGRRRDHGGHYFARMTIHITPWERRELPFGRGPGELPALLERLLGTPARLMALTMHEAPEKLSMRMQGRWSVLEHIGHLVHLQDRFDERVEDFAARRPCLCHIDLEGQDRLLPGYTGRALGDVLEEFRLKRSYFVERLTELDPGALDHRAEHPCSRMMMSVVDMATWLAEHDDHHLLSIRAMLQAGGRRSIAG